MTSIPKKYLDALLGPVDAVTTAEPKRGEQIFDGVDYPREWDGFIGQERAKEHLRVVCGSARARGVRLEHTLLASGLHGIGKTTLATLTAYHAGAGFLQTTGPLTASDARTMLRSMKDRDILFIDEAHLLVAGNKNKADWLLPYMTEGVLYTDRGAEKMPDVTILAATTDVGKLPATLISRFMVQPAIVPYTDDEGTQIVANLAKRMKVDLDEDGAAGAIAVAADNNPRSMRQILTGVRDLSYAYPDSHPNLAKAFEWAGVSADGLSQVARDILVLLLLANDHTMSLDSVRAKLGEPGPIAHHEQQLLRRHFVDVTPRGRKLTDAGITRAHQEARIIRGN